jgi:hypothetical protein
MNNFFDFSTNPYAQVIKKHLFDILKDKYPADDDVIDRIAKSLITPKDIEAFGSLVSSLYTAGYMVAVEQNRELFEKLGHKVEISYPETPGKKVKKIFPQEKSG